MHTVTPPIQSAFLLPDHAGRDLSLLYGPGPLALGYFFHAASAKELRAAGLSLEKAFMPGADGGVAALTGTDWQDAEYAFNRLFVGPGPVPAPPYASVYLQKDALLMGKSTLQFRQMLHSLGLSVQGEGAIPDDFLSFELAAWAQLCLLQAEMAAADEPDEAMQAMEETRRWLLVEHMAQWIPQFIQRVRAEENVPAVLSFAVSCLETWLRETLACERAAEEGRYDSLTSAQA